MRLPSSVSTRKFSMPDLLPAEPALIDAHDALSVALTLIGDYEFLDPQITPADIDRLALRAQMISARLGAIAHRLIQLNLRATRDDASGTGPAIPHLASFMTARQFLDSAESNLRNAPDALAGARKHLKLADQLTHPDEEANHA